MVNPNDEYEIKSFLFDSSNRNFGSVSNPTFIIPESFYCESIKIKSAMIPLSAYTFGTRNSNIFFEEQASAGTIRQATLTNSYYNSSSIITEIKTRLDSVGGQVYTVSYNEASNKITITAPGNFRFVSGTASALYELGLDSNTSYSTSHLANEQLDLSGVKTIHISSNINGINVFGSDKKILGSIICEEESLAISSFQDDSDDYVSSKSDINQISFNLLDERMRNITLSKNWSVIVNFLVK